MRTAGRGACGAGVEAERGCSGACGGAAVTSTPVASGSE